jgi:hypothetical protein
VTRYAAHYTASPRCRPARRCLVLLAAVSISAACDDGGATARSAPADSALAAAATADTITVSRPPERIYYDLMRVDWYARAEPLRHEGRSYAPGPDPVEAEPATMQRVGEYEGVDFYVRDDTRADSAVYVPVFERFWLPFIAAPDSAVPPDTSTTAPDTSLVARAAAVVASRSRRTRAAGADRSRAREPAARPCETEPRR